VIALIPNRKCEHPAKSLDASLALFFIEMNNGLSITARGKHVTAFDQRMAQLPVIVNFAVEYDPDRPVLIGHGLATGREIDNRKPAHAERHVVPDEVTFVIRAAVLDHIAHLLDGGSGHFWRRRHPSLSYESCDSTHRLGSRSGVLDSTLSRTGSHTTRELPPANLTRATPAATLASTK